MNFPQRTSNGVSADHDNFFRPQILAQNAAAAFKRGQRRCDCGSSWSSANLEFEIFPQAKVAQFDFRAEWMLPVSRPNAEDGEIVLCRSGG